MTDYLDLIMNPKKKVTHISEKGRDKTVKLSKIKKRDIKGFLEKTPETISFINATELLLSKYSDTFHIEGQELLNKKYHRLKEIQTLVNELKTFLSNSPVTEQITEYKIDNWLIDEIKRSLFSDKEHIDYEENLKFISQIGRSLSEIERAIEISFGSLIKDYVHKTKPKNIELQNFTDDLVSKFIRCMKRFPKISENGNDYRALSIIYNCYEPQTDRTKILKKTIKKYKEMQIFADYKK